MFTKFPVLKTFKKTKQNKTKQKKTIYKSPSGIVFLITK